MPKQRWTIIQPEWRIKFCYPDFLGKTITTSVPTFAFRFHAEDEELEEIYPSADETDEEADKQGIQYIY
ncbi:hypothetical protein ANN_06104 [Periplaneta americana]|uniref:Uncharacterized protein n=1 Tax=Periplaneta americana TaxID=6978 RepID=A0ABQ8TCM1_PERAM|nr:hypothetical protein ANN_06104 [Periplaneta americana]